MTMVQDEVSTTPATSSDDGVVTKNMNKEGTSTSSSSEEVLVPTAESSSVSSQHTPPTDDDNDDDTGALPSKMPSRKQNNENENEKQAVQQQQQQQQQQFQNRHKFDNSEHHHEINFIQEERDASKPTSKSTSRRKIVDLDDSLCVDLDDDPLLFEDVDEEEEAEIANDNNSNNNQSKTATSTEKEKEERPTLSKVEGGGGGSSFLVVKDQSLRSSIVGEAWGEDGPMEVVEEQQQTQSTTTLSQPQLTTTQLSRSTSFDEALISEHMNAKNNAPSNNDLSSCADNSSAAASSSATAAMRRKSRQLSRKKSSMLAVSDDPFAFREGKTLLWRNVNMTLKAKKSDGTDRKLLDSVWGEVPETETTAIMGPSGAGKTSLLNILAGRATSRGRLSIDADVRLNNYTVDPTDINVRKHIAFVAQDDSLQVTSTPRESIYFSAKLRLPRATPEKNLQKLVKKMLRELGLENCADTYVGGALLKGISGGERKRTSIGVELVVRPAMVFLDEPTSGLDSFSAVQLCQVLKKVANAGSSVLFTIHQPASEIFSSFDSLILMNKGRVMYQGHVEDVPEFFKARGDPLPPKYNPADWVMSVAQSLTQTELVEKGYFPKDERKLPEPFVGKMDGKDELGITITEGHTSEEGFDDSQHGFIVQIRLLFTRELKNLTRDKAAVGARFGLTTFLSILVGIIFLNVGQSDPAEPAHLQSQFGSLIMVVLMSMFGTAQPALLAFPEERPVFLREYSTNHYTVVSYFLSRLTMEAFITALQIMVQCLITYFLISFKAGFGIFYLTIYVLAMSSTALAVMLGCAVEDPKLGQEMLPLLFVPQMLFAGFFVTPDLIPAWLRWARYLCSLTYAIRIIMVEEFGNGSCGTGDGAIACESLLMSVDADPDETWWNWLVLVALFVVFRLFGLRILQQKAVKFF